MSICDYVMQQVNEHLLKFPIKFTETMHALPCKQRRYDKSSYDLFVGSQGKYFRGGAILEEDTVPVLSYKFLISCPVTKNGCTDDIMFSCLASMITQKYGYITVLEEARESAHILIQRELEGSGQHNAYLVSLYDPVTQNMANMDWMNHMKEKEKPQALGICECQKCQDTGRSFVSCYLATVKKFYATDKKKIHFDMQHGKISYEGMVNFGNWYDIKKLSFLASVLTQIYGRIVATFTTPGTENGNDYPHGVLFDVSSNQFGKYVATTKNHSKVNYKANPKIYIYGCGTKIRAGTPDERELALLFEINIETNQIIRISSVSPEYTCVWYSEKEGIDSMFITSYLSCYQFCDFPESIKQMFANLPIPSKLYFYKEQGFIANTLGDIAKNVPVKSFPKDCILEHVWCKKSTILFPYNYNAIPKDMFPLTDMGHDWMMKIKAKPKYCGICGHKLSSMSNSYTCSHQCHLLLNSNIYYIHCRNCGANLQKTDMRYECADCTRSAIFNSLYKRP